MDSTFLIVQERLLKIMQGQKFEENKLPSEEVLINLLDASRGTVREVLRSLNRKGFVTKKHGIGNFVHPRAINMKMRIDEFRDFINLIEDSGHKACLIKDGNPFEFSLRQDDSGEGLENYLEQGLQYICFSRIYLADQQPAIFSKLFFPERLFLKPPLGNVGYGNLFDFAKAHFNQEVEQVLTWINAGAANEQIAEKLKIPVGTAVLIWDELFCNYKDEIIGYSKTHFNPDIMKVCMLKKST